VPYATQQNLVDRFGEAEIKQIADRDGDGAIDAGVVAKALADAEAEIDSYIGNVYQLPLASVPARVVDLAQDLALYKLYASNPPEDVVRRYRDAIRFLEAVSAGKAVLPGLDGAPPPSAGAGVAVSAPERVFTRDTLKDL
jgi:phage gp36-like protein